MKAHIILGKNFGDEGKGLATDCFAGEAIKNNSSCIAVRFNGGAQAGHTVDTTCGRFVFHELSSASFRNVPTYWAKDFLPDLYKLPEEADAFFNLLGYVPKIYADGLCRMVNIDDVLVNMAIEIKRGKERHGSCGMGIYEAVVRSEKFPLYLKDIMGMSAEKLFKKMKELRSEYYPARLLELGINNMDSSNEYLELLLEDNVLMNAAEGILKGTEYIELKDSCILDSYDEVIFEGAQGLLLDTDNTEFAPHISASHTGAFSAVNICRKLKCEDIEIVYVTRTYVTRHGAGVLPEEEEWKKYNLNLKDETNVENPWQGIIRYAPHESIDRFLEAVNEDLSTINYPVKKSLFITHLNETGNNLLFSLEGNIDIESFLSNPKIKGVFDKAYVSSSPFAEECKFLWQFDEN